MKMRDMKMQDLKMLDVKTVASLRLVSPDADGVTLLPQKLMTFISHRPTPSPVTTFPVDGLSSVLVNS